MPHPTRRSSVAKDAIDFVVQNLTALPASAEVETLTAKAMAYLREVEEWQYAAPAAEERNRLMKRVLALHVEAASLKRQTGHE